MQSLLGKQSPWGKIQHVSEIADGIAFFSTPGHGGVKLDRKRNAKVPDYMRAAGGWYEEDCCYALAMVNFQDEFRAYLEKRDNLKQTDVEQQLEALTFVFRDYFPDFYARFYGVPIETLKGKSTAYDERLFNQEHANDWVSISAVGDWHKDCPQGMVLVTAAKGGRAINKGEKRSYLIPQEEYSQRSMFGFVIDPNRHKELDMVT